MLAGFRGFSAWVLGGKTMETVSRHREFCKRFFQIVFSWCVNDVLVLF